MQTQLALRWFEGANRWVRPDRDLFEPGRYEVGLIPQARARAFVETHHYLKSWCTSRCCVGLIESHTDSLVGVCNFGVPMNNASIEAHLQVEPLLGVELNRLILLDEIGYNGESWFVSRAQKLLKETKPDVVGILSYADPNQFTRKHDNGDVEIICPGHRGQVYSALSYRFIGQTSPRWVIQDMATGQIVSERLLTKLKRGDCAYAYAYVKQCGARRKSQAETAKAYHADAIAQLLSCGRWQRMRCKGKYIYINGVIGPKGLAGNNKVALPYPKTL